MIGATGVGKSTLLANQILADAQAKRGVIVIDPKGDLALDVLRRLPEDAQLVLFDPDDHGDPPGLNVLSDPDPDLLALLANRLTQRDRWLLEMLHTHRVFTLPQIADLAFGWPDTARHRLLTLYRLGAVSRFRPARDVGSAPHHYVLGPAGTAVLSAAKGEHIGYRHEYVVALAHSAKLTHIVGTNQIFCAFHAHARHTDGCELNRLVAQVDNYARLAEQTGERQDVLVRRQPSWSP